MARGGDLAAPSASPQRGGAGELRTHVKARKLVRGGHHPLLRAGRHVLEKALCVVARDHVEALAAQRVGPAGRGGGRKVGGGRGQRYWRREAGARRTHAALDFVTFRLPCAMFFSPQALPALHPARPVGACGGVRGR